MLQKKKYCSGCESEQYIWKNHNGERYCKSCWLRNNSVPKTRIQQVPLKSSIKKLAQDQLYKILRKKFFEDNDNVACKAHLEGCNIIACDVHHLYSGSSRGLYELDVTQWLPVCRNCHHKIHDVLTMEEVIALDLKRIN